MYNIIKENFGGSEEMYLLAEDFHTKATYCASREEYEEAKVYYEKAFQLGCGKSALQLSRHYKWGSFGKRDMEMASYYAKVAIQRHAPNAYSWLETLEDFIKRHY